MASEPDPEAVEQAVQAELEALVAGFRGVRVDAGPHQPGDVRELARGLDPLLEALVLGLALFGAHVRLGLVLVALEPDLLRLAHDRAHDERGDRAEDAEDQLDVALGPRPVDQAEQPLQVTHVVRSRRGPAADEIRRPAVPGERRPRPVREYVEVGAPVTRRVRHLDLALDAVQHPVEQLFLRPDVPVERHRAGVHLTRDAAHADRVRALGVGHRDGGRDDLLQGQALAAPGRPRAALLVLGDVPGDPRLPGRLPGARERALVPEERPLLLVALTRGASRPPFAPPACPNQGHPVTPRPSGDNDLPSRTAYCYRTSY